MHFDQLAQWCVQRLLGNAQVAQQFLDAQVGIAGDKEQDAVMHAGQTATGQHLVRLCRESLIAEKEAFHYLALHGAFLGQAY